MATAIADLLDGLHATAWTLCDTPTEPDPAATTARLLAGWPALAATTRRAIENIPLDREARKFTASLRTSLLLITAQRTTSRAVGASPDDGLRDMTWRVGAIADLLTDAPRARDGNDRLAGIGLVANLAAPIHAATTWTLALADQTDSLTSTRWLFRQLAGHTQPYLHTRPADRAGRYDDLTVPRSDERSLPAALHRWRAATLDELSSPWRVTRASLQTTAIDLVLLTAAAATTTWAGIHQGHLDREHCHATIDTLRAANAAWRTASRWPSHLRLDGARTPGNADASADFRATINDTLRSGNDWATPDQIAQRTDLPRLIRTMREGVRAAEDIAVNYYAAHRQHVFGANRLWIAAPAIDTGRPLDRDLLDDRHRRRWTPRPIEEQSGLGLLEAAAVAANATTAARKTFDHPRGERPVEGELRLTDRRLASGLTDLDPNLGPWEIPAKGRTVSGGRARSEAAGGVAVVGPRGSAPSPAM